jgi:hypothetical protein
VNTRVRGWPCSHRKVCRGRGGTRDGGVGPRDIWLRSGAFASSESGVPRNLPLQLFTSATARLQNHFLPSFGCSEQELCPSHSQCLMILYRPAILDHAAPA